MKNRRESLVWVVLFIALLFFCILMSLVPLLASTTARADSITFEQFYQASLDMNARETKNLQESQWLMKLHRYGLLRNSFRPSNRT